MTSSAWRKLHCIAAEEGLVAIAYERKHGQWRLASGTVHDMAVQRGCSAGSRLHQIAKTHCGALPQVSILVLGHD